MPAKRTGDKPGQSMTRTKIPGGEASWWSPEELPTYKEREITIASMQINKAKLKALQSAKDVRLEDDTMPTMEEIALGELSVLTEAEARALVHMTDIAIWAYLKSWTLTEIVDDQTADGKPAKVRVPIPLPETPDQVPFLPKNIYNALMEHANIIIAKSKVLNESFAPNGDQESPTTD